MRYINCVSLGLGKTACALHEDSGHVMCDQLNMTANVFHQAWERQQVLCREVLGLLYDKG